MSLFPRRRHLAWMGVALVAMVLAWAGARFWLGGYVVRSVLRLAGATEIRFREVRGTPWQAEIEDLAFMVEGQAVSIQRVSLQRAHWWQASLGDVRVEQARMVAVIDGSDVDPWQWKAQADPALGDEPVQLPFRSLALQGELVVRMGTLPDMPIRIELNGQPRDATSWTGRLEARGPGFTLAGTGALLRAGQELDFDRAEGSLDLGIWSRHIQRLVALPGGPWDMAGKLEVVGRGNVTARRFASTAHATIRDGRMRANVEGISASGIEVDLEFSDLWKLRTKSGNLRVTELRAHQLVFRGVTADLGLWDGRQVSVARASAVALGGRVESAPFRYQLDQRTVGLTLRGAGLNAAQLLALAPGVAPRLSGRIDAQLDLLLRDNGVFVAGGWLKLAPGSRAELQLNAAALLRSGATLASGSDQLFKAAGTQSVVLPLTALQLDVRPDGLPLGTSARLEANGSMDGESVGFVYHVNGPVEGLVQLGATAPRR